MPTYEYRCKDCGQELEVVQSFTDDALTTCEACSGSLRKVFGNVGIAFKGSGFYKNDARGKPAAAAKAGNGTEPAGSGTSSDSGSSDTKDAGSTTKTDTTSSTTKTEPTKTAAPST